LINAPLPQNGPITEKERVVARPFLPSLTAVCVTDTPHFVSIWKDRALIVGVEVQWNENVR
jgi:hypothetical protein